MNPKSARATREERENRATIPLNGGTSARCIVPHAALIRVIRSARRNLEPLEKRRASEMTRDR